MLSYLGGSSAGRSRAGERPGGIIDLRIKIGTLLDMVSKRSSFLRLPLGWPVAFAFASAALVAAWAYSRTPNLQRGETLYMQHCAACHGTRLEGQPEWQKAGEDGILPAPPHDETGHTWHHDDAMLTDYIHRGGQAVLDDMGVAMTSGMPAFGEVLSAGEIAAILAFIKSRWPARLQAIQARRNNG
ncbi:c-type cytochrome [Paracoccus rhizosphaerae]|uniref:C-type cytochrome n=1 Tax=Paracoccus rhizosphaerae TaxID=1133347 RepID=A0ABV6CFS4_9RHOB|nr:cytochrome c [Paracoccus rhizosphaerae]